MVVQVEKIGKRRCKPGERRLKEGLYGKVSGFIACNCREYNQSEKSFLKIWKYVPKGLTTYSEKPAYSPICWN